MTRKKRSVAGHTLVEALISAALTLVILGVSIALWKLCETAFLKTDRKTKLLGDLQLVARAVKSSALQASRASFTFVDTPAIQAIAFLSPRAERASGQNLVLEPSLFAIEWKKYDCFYLDRTANKIFWTEVALEPSALQRQAPTTIEGYDPGTGPRPLETYCTGGRKLCDGVDTLSGSWENGLATIVLSGMGQSDTAMREERLTITLTIDPRN